MSCWRPVVNSILHSVQFDRELDDHVVAHTPLTEPLATLTPMEEIRHSPVASRRESRFQHSFKCPMTRPNCGHSSVE